LGNFKKKCLVLKAGFQETVSDKRMLLVLLIIGFILDNGVRCMVRNAIQVEQPLGIFEGFIMCINHWYYLIVFLLGYIVMLTGIPRLDSGQLFLIYRIGKKNWIIGEIFQIAFSSLVYVLLLLLGCIISVAKYSYIGNVWSNFTVDYKALYEELLSDGNRFIDQQVFKYYLPYQTVIHGILLLILCMTLMGTIVIFFYIIDHKLIGIVINSLIILSVLIFNERRMGLMWVSPFCHSVLALHNVYVYKQMSVPLYWSYLYLGALEVLMVGLTSWKLKKKMFY
jgi:hypothetical protein